jgi:xanthine dehydrogenase molybdopterin-binding subunit B
MAAAPYRAKGTVLATGQSHFYMEAHSSIATRVDGEVIEVTCGTQDPTTWQGYLARTLGVNASKVVVKCLRE